MAKIVLKMTKIALKVTKIHQINKNNTIVAPWVLRGATCGVTIVQPRFNRGFSSFFLL